jgi:hypothetical protein
MIGPFPFDPSMWCCIPRHSDTASDTVAAWLVDNAACFRSKEIYQKFGFMALFADAPLDQLISRDAVSAIR